MSDSPILSEGKAARDARHATRQAARTRRQRVSPGVVDLTGSSPVVIKAATHPDGVSPEVIYVPPTPQADRAGPSYAPLSSLSPSPTPVPTPNSPKASAQEDLGEFTCPICFGPPLNACLTPCGHVMCGGCLFPAVKANLKRAIGAYTGTRGGDNNAARYICLLDLISHLVDHQIGVLYAVAS